MQLAAFERFDLLECSTASLSLNVIWEIALERFDLWVSVVGKDVCWKKTRLALVHNLEVWWVKLGISVPLEYLRLTLVAEENRISIGTNDDQFVVLIASICKKNENGWEFLPCQWVREESDANDIIFWN